MNLFDYLISFFTILCITGLIVAFYTNVLRDDLKEIKKEIAILKTMVLIKEDGKK